MPINPYHRHHYPPDWRELAAHIKFERTGGHCEWCGWPHGERVGVIKAGGWLDPETGERYDEEGRALGWIVLAIRLARRVVRENNPDLRPPGSKSHPQRSPLHLRYDRRQRIQSAYRNQRQRRTVRDLFD